SQAARSPTPCIGSGGWRHPVLVLIGASALILALRPRFSLVFVAEILHGMTSGIVGTAIAAISLGLAGRHGMSCRVGRNYRFAGAGNAVTAALMGGLGAYLSNSAIFIATAVLCIPALIALTEIRPNEIDYVRARNATKRDHTLDLQRLVDFTKNWRLVLFAGCLVLFHFSSASCCPWSAKISRTARSPTALCSWRASSWARQSWSRFLRRGLGIGPRFGGASRCCSPASPSKRRARCSSRWSPILS